MFKFSKKDSEHTDLYHSQKFDAALETDQGPQESKDELYKFKKTVSLTKPYEVYIETEKKYQTVKREQEKRVDPMEIIVKKMRRGEHMFLRDYKYWVMYNFLAFSEQDQQKIKKINERQQWFWRRMQFFIPPIWGGCYAVYKYQLRFGVLRNFIASSVTVFAVCRLGLMSSNSEMKRYYMELYDLYQDEVLSPEHRGKKLYGGKKSYQVDDLEFTSSNFDDLKRIIFNQKSK